MTEVVVGKSRVSWVFVPVTVFTVHLLKFVIKSPLFYFFHCICLVLCGMLHIYVLFSLFLSLPTLTPPSLCVGGEDKSRGTRGWRQVVGRSCLTDTSSVCFSVCPRFYVDVIAELCFSYCTANRMCMLSLTLSLSACRAQLSVFWAVYYFVNHCTFTKDKVQMETVKTK